jgi:hypothetical protein
MGHLPAKLLIGKANTYQYFPYSADSAQGYSNSQLSVDPVNADAQGVQQYNVMSLMDADMEDSSVLGRWQNSDWECPDDNAVGFPLCRRVLDYHEVTKL